MLKCNWDTVYDSDLNKPQCSQWWQVLEIDKGCCPSVAFFNDTEDKGNYHVWSSKCVVDYCPTLDKRIGQEKKWEREREKKRKQSTFNYPHSREWHNFNSSVGLFITSSIFFHFIIKHNKNGCIYKYIDHWQKKTNRLTCLFKD